MVVRLLGATEEGKMNELKQKRAQNIKYYEDLKMDLKREVGEDIVEQELQSAINLFDKYDTNKNGFLEEFEVPQIIKDTYNAMGKEYVPTLQDVK